MSHVLLKTEDHSRDSAGMRYIYPVLSRRAGGVSLGINLNPNNACNWRCIYCQVPDLTRGGPPPIDLALLERELASMFDAIQSGDFLVSRVPAGTPLADLAFSGNGEPTSAQEFPAAVSLVRRQMEARGLAGKVPLRLITNGSLLDRKTVQQGIAELGQTPGEVWFKFDSATSAGMSRINSTRAKPESVLRRLQTCASLAPTWIQTCVFCIDQRLPEAGELAAYVDAVASLRGKVAGVHLYSLARPSLQKEAPRLGRLDAAVLDQLAEQLRARGLTVTVSP